MAFYIKEVDGIGLMHRAFKGTTPDGRSWDDLANAMAGKQVSGLVGLSAEYLRSPKFLQADGGWNRIVWMPHELKKQFASDKDWITTEVDVKNIQELTEFLSTNKRP